MLFNILPAIAGWDLQLTRRYQEGAAEGGVGSKKVQQGPSGSGLSDGTGP